MTEKTRIARLKKWVAALRSGKYKQHRGALSNGERGKYAAYCCIGVAGKVWRKYDEAYAVVDQTCGIDPTRDKDVLIDMNDKERQSFKFIASWIEKNLIKKAVRHAK